MPVDFDDDIVITPKSQEVTDTLDESVGRGVIPPLFGDRSFFDNNDGRTWHSKRGSLCYVQSDTFVCVWKSKPNVRERYRGYGYGFAKFGDKVWSGCGYDRWRTQEEALAAAIIQAGTAKPTRLPSKLIFLDDDDVERPKACDIAYKESHLGYPRRQLDLSCPLCGCENTHTGHPSELDKPSNGGDHEISIPMSCEDGCHWAMVVIYHEGRTSIVTQE